MCKCSHRKTFRIAWPCNSNQSSHESYPSNMLNSYNYF
jgi:hypothetical protein